MMKKMLAILCAMMMVLAIAPVWAEEAEETVEIGQQVQDFSITMTVPEGYVSSQYYVEGNMYVSVTDENDITASPIYVITIAYSEEYDGQTLSVLSDEEKEAFIAQMGVEMNNPVFSQKETGNGSAVFFLEDDVEDAELSFAIGMSVYEGYVVNMYITPAEDRALSDEDIALGLQILTDLWFVAAE